MAKPLNSVLATAPGKVILFGEHAVVYGRPAIAVPVTKVQATAIVEAAAPGSGCTISAPDIAARIHLSSAPDDPLAMAVRLALKAAGVDAEPDWNIVVTSTIPIAGGMGSGAAVSAVLARPSFHIAQLSAAVPTSKLLTESSMLSRKYITPRQAASTIPS